MTAISRLAILGLVFASIALRGAAAEIPSWALTLPDRVQPPSTPKDAVTKTTVPGSRKYYTQVEIDDYFSPPDWFPDEHPPVPDVVKYGRKPSVRACAVCHLANGMGRPENAPLAGLPADYIKEQITAFKNGERAALLKSMTDLAQAATDEEIDSAARWYAVLPATKTVRVVQTAMVPKTYVFESGMRLRASGGGMEPIGVRVIELPEDETRAMQRDPHAGFIAYVPEGAIARGQALVKTGGGKTTPCASCHGAKLTGRGATPPIAGRSPLHAARQMFKIQAGLRSGRSVETMQPVVAKLSDGDLVDIVAYLGSLEP